MLYELIGAGAVVLVILLFAVNCLHYIGPSEVGLVIKRFGRFFFSSAKTLGLALPGDLFEGPVTNEVGPLPAAKLQDCARFQLVHAGIDRARSGHIAKAHV